MDMKGGGGGGKNTKKTNVNTINNGEGGSDKAFAGEKSCADTTKLIQEFSSARAKVKGCPGPNGSRPALNK